MAPLLRRAPVDDAIFNYQEHYITTISGFLPAGADQAADGCR